MGQLGVPKPHPSQNCERDEEDTELVSEAEAGEHKRDHFENHYVFKTEEEVQVQD